MYTASDSRSTLCGRQASFQTLVADQLGLRQKQVIVQEPVIDELAEAFPPPVSVKEATHPAPTQADKTRLQNHSPEEPAGGPLPVKDDPVLTEMRQFRNVHLTALDHVTSIEEARHILCKDPDNPSALRYLAACRMCYPPYDAGYYHPGRRCTLRNLERACHSGITVINALLHQTDSS